MNIGTAWHQLSMLLEGTQCAATLTEISAPEDGPTVCSSVVTRYPRDNEFPAYEDEICTVETATWSEAITLVTSMLESGDIPED